MALPSLHRPYGPPGGERLGRLPGPSGLDRLASGAPRPGPAAARAVPAKLRADAVFAASEPVTDTVAHTAGSGRDMPSIPDRAVAPATRS
ncbi:hypothetical protein [Streptomyces sp. NPDC127190]|uniref:hypothetical protein n=1 Tax=unclassified Streptomyces TaxID=2593676 RepID=UPI0036257F43